MKKQLLLFTCWLLWISPHYAQAQQGTMELPNSMVISDVSIKRVGGTAYDGGKVWLNFDVSSPKNISSRAILTLIPTLRDDGETYRFPSVKIMQKKALLMSERRGEVFDPNTLVLSNNEVGGYSVGVPYEDWMNGATLSLENSVQFCQELYAMPTKNIARDLILADQIIEPLLIMAIPLKVSTIEKMTDTAYLEFKVASNDLNLSFADNRAEMAKIKLNIDNIEGSTNSQDIKKIELCGMSSPEGNYEFNAQLAKRRADAVMNYLSINYNYPKDLYSLTSVAEDWDGLRSVIQESSLKNKNQILSIINDESLTPTQKDSKMKALPNYSMLLKNYYPRLRRVNYTIHYDTQQTRTVDEILALYESSPEALSEMELYQVVKHHRPKGKRYYNTVDNWAEKLYPQSAVAQINKAVCDIERKHPRRARKSLRNAARAMEIQGLAKAPEVAAVYFNTSGALELLDGDIDGARILFRQAADMGLNEGVVNISRLK